MNGLQRVVMSTLKIPPPPAPPEGSPASQASFRAAPGFFRYLIFKWAIAQVGAAAGLFFGVAFLTYVPDGWWTPWLGYAEVLALLSYLAQLVLGLVALSLDYRMRWYMVSDRALRVREGILSTHEQTLSFANIQNLQVKQGPVQRFLGIADLEVTTAGGGGASSHEGVRRNLHLARFQGVDNAEQIRQLILDRQRNFRDSGLGDLDDAPQEAEDLEHALVEAAQELTKAARALATAA